MSCKGLKKSYNSFLVRIEVCHLFFFCLKLPACDMFDIWMISEERASFCFPIILDTGAFDFADFFAACPTDRKLPPPIY